MSQKIYIDGHAGTTGLRIRDWLAGRDDLELVILPDELRKDSDARREAVLTSDISVLCLPDEAALEVAAWAKGSDARIIDASTAHRVNPDWVFGLPEMQPDQRDRIRNAQWVSNPGCWSSSTILLLRPLIDAGLVSKDALIFIHGISGYSGGGRALIEKWQDSGSALPTLPFAAPYAYGWKHKHIPEMRRYCGLASEPQFTPSVGPYECGMRLQVPLHASMLKGTPQDIHAALSARYDGETFVKVQPFGAGEPYDELSFDPQVCNDTNRIELRVLAHPDGHVTMMAVLDNLGKGASGMAIQSLNLMTCSDESTGLPVTV